MYSAAARQQKYLSLARDNTETLAPGGSVKGSVGVIAIGYLIVALREPPRFARLINNENLEAAGLTLLRRFRRWQFLAIICPGHKDEARSQSGSSSPRLIKKSDAVIGAYTQPH